MLTVLFGRIYWKRRTMFSTDIEEQQEDFLTHYIFLGLILN